MSTADALAALEAAAQALGPAEEAMNTTARAAQEAAQRFAAAKGRLYAAALAYEGEQGE